MAVANLADFSVAGKGAQTSPISNAFQAMYDESSDAVLHGTGQETFEAVKMLKSADPAKYQPAAGVKLAMTTGSAPHGRVHGFFVADKAPPGRSAVLADGVIRVFITVRSLVLVGVERFAAQVGNLVFGSSPAAVRDALLYLLYFANKPLVCLEHTFYQAVLMIDHRGCSPVQRHVGGGLRRPGDVVSAITNFLDLHATLQ